MRKSIFFLCFVFLLVGSQSFSKEKSGKAKLNWSHQYDSKLRQLTFRSVPKGTNPSPMKVRILGTYAPKKKDNSFMATEGLSTPVLMTPDRENFFLITYWNTGKLGYIRVFNPNRGTGPLCELVTQSDILSDSDHVVYRVSGKQIDIEVLKGKKFSWKKCTQI